MEFILVLPDLRLIQQSLSRKLDASLLGTLLTG